MKKLLLLPALLTAVLTAAIFGVVLVARAGAPDDPTCPLAEQEPHCVVLAGVQGRDKNGWNPTSYVLTNNTNQWQDYLYSYFDITGTLILTENGSLWPQRPQNYAFESPQIPRGYTGTVVLTSTGDFTIQIIGPTATCPTYSGTNTPQVECMTVHLPAGQAQYTVYNRDNTQLTYNHDIYQGGSLLRTFSDTLPPFTHRTYSAATGAPIGRAATASTQGYDVVIRAPKPISVDPGTSITPTPVTPTPQPKPRYDVSFPFITRRGY
jgi:hypothetical protein